LLLINNEKHVLFGTCFFYFECFLWMLHLPFDGPDFDGFVFAANGDRPERDLLEFIFVLSQGFIRPAADENIMLCKDEKAGSHMTVSLVAKIWVKLFLWGG
jgi:hypothetical protein